jgi:hypothetical protein
MLTDPLLLVALQDAPDADAGLFGFFLSRIVDR